MDTSPDTREFSQRVIVAMLRWNAAKTHIVNKSSPCFLYKLIHVDTYPSI